MTSGFFLIKTLAEVIYQDELLIRSYEMNYKGFYEKISTDGTVKVGDILTLKDDNSKFRL